MAKVTHYDYIIVGSGIAGLYSALLAKEFGSVLVLTKSAIDDSNTYYAQGGLAALIRKESRRAHYRTDFPETSKDWGRHITFRKR